MKIDMDESTKTYIKRYILAYLWITAVFAVLTFFEVHAFADGYNHWQRVFLTTLFTPTGPFCGGVCRLWSQGITEKAVIPSLWWTMGPLLFAVIFSLIFWRKNRFMNMICLVSCCIGLIWWNICGLLFILGSM